MQRSLRAGLILLALGVSTTPGVAQEPAGFDLVKVLSPDPDERFLFGSSVDVSGDIMAVGAIGRGRQSVAAYVFERRRGDWVLQAEISRPNPNNFPLPPAVAISGDTMVLGLESDNAAGFRSGAAYVYVRQGSTWSLQARLTASDAGEQELFGYTVAIEGDTIAVGAITDGEADRAGAVYVFRRTGAGWAQEAKLKPRALNPGAQFGHSLSLDGGTLAVGAHFDRDDPGGTGASSGSVYVFVRQGERWVRQARLTPPDADAGQFGETVSVSGDTLAVGAFPNQAYVYTREGDEWRLETTVRRPADPEAAGFFGFYVGVSERFLVVFGNVRVPGQGTPAAAYLYERQGGEWVFRDRVVSAARHVDVDIEGDTIAVGSGEDDEAGVDSGAVFVFVPESGRVDLNVRLLAPQRPTGVGSVFAYRARVTNQGPAAASRTRLRIDLPDGVSPRSVLTDRGVCTRRSNLVVCDLGTLAPGESVRVIVRAVSSDAGTKTATATASATRKDADPADNTARAEALFVAF